MLKTEGRRAGSKMKKVRPNDGADFDLWIFY